MVYFVNQYDHMTTKWLAKSIYLSLLLCTKPQCCAYPPSPAHHEGFFSDNIVTFRPYCEHLYIANLVMVGYHYTPKRDWPALYWWVITGVSYRISHRYDETLRWTTEETIVGPTLVWWHILICMRPNFKSVRAWREWEREWIQFQRTNDVCIVLAGSPCACVLL